MGARVALNYIVYQARTSQRLPYLILEYMRKNW